MATLKDVAAMAGVSTATASLSLNNGPVNKETRACVLLCAQRLNYIPNRIGRILTGGRSNIIQLLIMTAGGYADTVRQTALFYYLIAGVLSVMDERSYTVRFDVRSYDDTALPRYFEHVVGDNLLDGIIVVPQFDHNHDFARTLQRAGFPHILLSPRRFATGVNHVDMSNEHGGRLVAELFAAGGRRRIAMVNGPATHVDSIERKRGFGEGLRAAGIDNCAYHFGDFTIESGHAAMRGLLTGGQPDAVFCANDYMAAGTIKALNEAGLRVPDDVSVVGYDNSDVARAVTPALTSVDNHFFELGRILAQDLLSLIRDDSGMIARTLVPMLIKRDSH